ncbi:hypothetical protein [Rubrolithibacter danxiaensis]|uniref:hypothetical protein n=1 Tax=Rubrolithibacter danxiaensis TaxID=3390805 RepID=UPI003BF8A26B
MKKHQGQIIKSTLKEIKVSIAELSRIIGETPRIINKWLSLQELNPEIISTIGKAAGYDFSSEFPDLNLENPVKETAERNMDEENTKQEEIYWMNKYIELLEKYNDLLSKQIEV